MWLTVSAKFARILDQVFTDVLSNSPKCSPRFSPGYEGTEKMFYFLNRDNIGNEGDGYGFCSEVNIYDSNCGGDDSDVMTVMVMIVMVIEWQW